jgi:hypothetical protein
LRSPDPLLSRLPLIEVGLLGLVAVSALIFQLTLPARFASEADYAQVRAVLEAEAQPGDVVLLQPWWTERARLFLPPSVPVVGYLGSDGDPLTAHPRIWRLSQPGLPRAGTTDFEEKFLPQREPAAETRQFGHLALTLYRNRLHRPTLFSLAADPSKARVSLQLNDRRADCPFDGRAHRCPNGTVVSTEWRELRFQPRRCLNFFPPGGDARVVAELDVPVGERLSLQGGITWEHAARRDPAVSAVRFGVENAAGEPLLEISLPPGLEGAQKHEVDLAQRAGPVVPLRLWASAEKSEARELCLDLLTLGPLQ